MLASTTDTAVVSAYFSGKGVVVDQAGKSPRWEYSISGMKTGYVLQYHITAEEVQVVTIVDREIVGDMDGALTALRDQLGKDGYVRGESSGETSAFPDPTAGGLDGQLTEWYGKRMPIGMLEVYIQIYEQDGQIVDFALGSKAPRNGKRIGAGAANTEKHATSGVRIHLDKDGLLIDTLNFKGDWTVQRFDRALKSKGRLVVHSDKERKDALKKFGKALKTDQYLYDSVGVHLYVNHATKRVEEVSVDFKTGLYKNSPLLPFSGSFLIDQNDLSRATTLYDLRHIGFKPGGLLPFVKQLDYNDFKLIFEFDSSAADSRLASVGISFLSDDMVLRNPYGWSDEDVAAMRTMARNQLEQIADPNAVDFEALLDCYCNWIKNNVPSTDLSNPTEELGSRIKARFTVCAEKARKQ